MSTLHIHLHAVHFFLGAKPLEALLTDKRIPHDRTGKIHLRLRKSLCPYIQESGRFQLYDIAVLPAPFFKTGQVHSVPGLRPFLPGGKLPEGQGKACFFIGLFT